MMDRPKHKYGDHFWGQNIETVCSAESRTVVLWPPKKMFYSGNMIWLKKGIVGLEEYTKHHCLVLVWKLINTESIGLKNLKMGCPYI